MPRDEGRKFRLPLWLTIPAGLVSGIFLYGYIYNHVQITRIDNILNPRYGYATDAREKYFTRSVPSSREIKEYLSNATILQSNASAAGGNSVYYFNENHGIVLWGFGAVSPGKWWTSPKLELMLFGERWRIAVIQIFCHYFFDRPEEAQQDNCYEANLSKILVSPRGTRSEYRKGNIFNLSGDKPAPIAIPKSELTIDSLLQTISSSSNK